MKTLLIDNYDSYTYNLFQILTKFSEVVVVNNDSAELTDMDLGKYDAVVVSPGPGDPSNLEDFGYASLVYENQTVPILGVCLGHQGLAVAAKGNVEPAPEPKHGFVGSMTHFGDPLFKGVPTHFDAVRYHSLAVKEPVPEDIAVVARSDDGVVMGLRHSVYPHWGVQFHPESIATTYGEQIIVNFLNLAIYWRMQNGLISSEYYDENCILFAYCEDLPNVTDSVYIAECFNEHYEQWVWLDCALPADDRARYSFFVPVSNENNEVVVQQDATSSRYTVTDELGEVNRSGDILSYLKSEINSTHVSNVEAIPGPFKGGYVGFLGYEMKALCGLHSFHHADSPDAVWIRCRRYVVFDHLYDRAYAIELTATPNHSDWSSYLFESDKVISSESEASKANIIDSDTVLDRLVASLARPREEYVEQIKIVDSELRKGNSYEVCFTNSLHISSGGAISPDFKTYLELRSSNPAPYSAFMRLRGLAIYCSSPECFLTIDSNKNVKSRPIKGTAARSADPSMDAFRRDSLSTDSKTFAENLMIVDLVRNDLGRVCVPGSVSVPDYMTVESYETVHQLVSTISGRLEDDADVVDAIRASFPPGSMTGAPKLRTTDIIDSLETEARGVYSGSIGYMSYDGAADLNVVIRTAVEHGGVVSIGSGGAVILDSDPNDEYDEMLLKAKALVRVFGHFEQDGDTSA